MESEAVLRFSIFAAVFAGLAFAEFVAPLRAGEQRLRRWPTNFGLLVLNTLLLRLSSFAVPALPVFAAIVVERNGIGLLPMLGMDGTAATVIAFVVLDVALYAQHWAMHNVAVLWRLHRVHHADAEFDVTTGLRFHPLEIVVSQAWKIAVIALVGAPALAVLVFEIVLNASSMFTHTNISLGRADRFVRAVLVTPDMHRIHHSIVRRETDSNYGFNLALWDRVFGTYRQASASDQGTMPIGLASYRESGTARFGWLLAFPFAHGARA